MATDAITPFMVCSAARALYGQAWKTQLARDLARVLPADLAATDRKVREIADAQRSGKPVSIPEAWRGALLGLMDRSPKPYTQEIMAAALPLAKPALEAV